MTMTVEGTAASGTGGGGTPESKPKGKKKLPKIIAAVVLVAAVGYVAKGKVIKPHYGPHHAAPAGTVDSLGELTVNLSDGHLLQTTIALQLTAVAPPKTIAADQPQFQNAAIAVLGAYTYPQLLAPGERSASQTALLAQFQKIAGDSDGVPAVTAVYYTGFVMQ
jgi:flagellar basal body-associated protein FliL